MKKIALLLVFSAFVAIMGNAQVTKRTFQNCHSVENFIIPGTGIEANGEICVTHTFWFIPILPGPVKHNAIITGELTDGDGNVYTFQHFVHHRNEGVPNIVGANYGNTTWTDVIKLNGKPFAVIHFTHHITMNPDGEVVTEFEIFVDNFH